MWQQPSPSLICWPEMDVQLTFLLWPTRLSRLPRQLPMSPPPPAPTTQASQPPQAQPLSSQVPSGGRLTGGKCARHGSILDARCESVAKPSQGACSDGLELERGGDSLAEKAMRMGLAGHSPPPEDCWGWLLGSLACCRWPPAQLQCTSQALFSSCRCHRQSHCWRTPGHKQGQVEAGSN